jgi:predicted transcriptional regulator
MPDMKRVFHVSATFAESEQWDLRQYRAMSAEQRLAAVEFLREQCWVAAGLKEWPRIQKTGRIVETGTKRKDTTP